MKYPHLARVLDNSWPLSQGSRDKAVQPFVASKSVSSPGKY